MDSLPPFTLVEEHKPFKKKGWRPLDRSHGRFVDHLRKRIVAFLALARCDAHSIQSEARTQLSRLPVEILYLTLEFVAAAYHPNRHYPNTAKLKFIKCYSVPFGIAVNRDGEVAVSFRQALYPAKWDQQVALTDPFRPDGIAFTSRGALVVLGDKFIDILEEPETGGSYEGVSCLPLDGLGGDYDIAPCAMAADLEGNIVLVDGLFLWVLRPNGEILHQWKISGLQPCHIAVTSAGKFLIGDAFRVLTFANGTIEAALPRSVWYDAECLAIAADADDNIVMAHPNGIGVYTSRMRREVHYPVRVSRGSSLAVAPNGTILVADRDGKQIILV